MSVKRKYTTDFPVTTVKPDDEKDDQNGLLNVRESGILLPALRFSRENNLKASFTKYSVQNKIFFRPDLPENSLPIPYTGLLGTCTLSIGPFLYLDTQIYELLFVSQQILLDQNQTQDASHSFSQQVHLQTQQQNQQQTHQFFQQPQQLAFTTVHHTQVQPTFGQTSYPTIRPLAPAPIMTSLQSSPQPSSRIYKQPAIQPRPQPQSQVPQLAQVISHPQVQQRMPIPRLSSQQHRTSPTTSSSSSSSNNSVKFSPQLTSVMQTLLQTYNPTQILAIQKQLSQPETAPNLSQEQKSALINHLSYLLASQSNNSSQVNSSQVNSPQVNSPQVNSPQVNSPQVNSPQVNSPLTVPVLHQRPNSHSILSKTVQSQQYQSGQLVFSQDQTSEKHHLVQSSSEQQQQTSLSNEQMIQSDEQNQEIQSIPSPERQTTSSSQKRNVFQQLSPSSENHVVVELPSQPKQTVNSLSSQRMLIATESAHYAALNKFKMWNQPAEILASTAYEHAVRCEVILTFKEDRKTRYLFPKDAIIERNPEGDDNLYEVIASYVSPSDENDVKRSRDNPEEWEISIKSVTEEIWNALYRTVNDEGTVERLMDEKLKRKCKERYLQMRVPRDFNREKIKKYQKTWTTTVHINESKMVDEVIDIEKKTDDSEIDMDTDITVGRKRAKRKAPGQKRTAPAVTKKVRKTKNTPKNDTSKKTKSSTSTSKKSRSIPDSTGTVEPSSEKKNCMYCGARYTPMWRRGPKGPGTLCNACGVKWKQGKIIIEESPDDDTEPNDSISVAQSSKPRKSSISAGKATTHSSPAKSGKKPSRLLSFNEGVISHTDEEEGRAEKPRVSRRGSTAGAPKRGRRASSSSKKGIDRAQTPEPESVLETPVSKPNFTPSQNSSVFPMELAITSISFGPGLAIFSEPDCYVTLEKNKILIGLKKDGHDPTEIEIWKNYIDDINYSVEKDLSTGYPMLEVTVNIGQYITRFDMVILDGEHSSVVFKFVNLDLNFEPGLLADSGIIIDEGNDTIDLRTLFQRWSAIEMDENAGYF